jgi:hypothetical protein
MSWCRSKLNSSELPPRWPLPPRCYKSTATWWRVRTRLGDVSAWKKKQDQTISKPYLLYVYIVYHLVISHSHGKSKITMLLIGKPSINRLFSMAMLNNYMCLYVLYCFVAWMTESCCWSPYIWFPSHKNWPQTCDMFACLGSWILRS